MLEWSCLPGMLICLPRHIGKEQGEAQPWIAGVSLHLKLGAIAGILITGACGVTLPLLGRRLALFKTDGPYFMVAKAFAAGVILATGFVHMLPDATESLTDSCLPDFPWTKFPFSGCIAMLAALGTLMVDVVGTEYYERKHAKEQFEDVIQPTDLSDGPTTEIAAEKDVHSENDQMHIVGIRAHAASHTHDMPSHHEHQHGSFQRSSSDRVSSHIRHMMVSQVLELGIVTHSIIIGISLGVSDSPCTIRPLFAALAFHQFFEGFALGGCISQAGFKSLLTVLMAVCFTLTTPLGIAVGIGISSRYNANSPVALIVEGIFDAVSAGILIYMALVDLIAADFLSRRVRYNRISQTLSYISLLLGSASMSALALWA